LKSVFQQPKLTWISRSSCHRAFQRQRNAAGRKHSLHACLFHDVFGFTWGIGDDGVLIFSRRNRRTLRMVSRSDWGNSVRVIPAHYQRFWYFYTRALSKMLIFAA
jgi:hypothetical protein